MVFDESHQQSLQNYLPKKSSKIRHELETLTSSFS